MGQILVVTRPSDVFVKGPGETRDVPVDWSEDLPAGMTITGSVFVPDLGLTVDSSTFSDNATAVRLSGGVNGRRYKVRNSVTVSDGEVLVYPFDVWCRE